MNYIISEMIKMFSDNINNNKNVLREVLQKVILYSLYKTPLGNNCCFIGGTCLRIFHNIDRFSQDLDFVFIDPDKKIILKDSLDKMNQILQSFGLKSEYNIKHKTIENNTIVVFFRFDLQTLYDNYYPNMKWKVTNGQSIKIELDFDTTKYHHINTETWFDVFPQYFQTIMLDMPSLFASKIAAILLRTWNNRGFKGRDLYDFIFYVSLHTPINLYYLKEKLLLANRINKNYVLDLPNVKKLLINKFNSIDFKQAKEDVEMFVNNVDSLKQWSREYFIDIVKNKL